MTEKKIAIKMAQKFFKENKKQNILLSGTVEEKNWFFLNNNIIIIEVYVNEFIFSFLLSKQRYVRVE